MSKKSFLYINLLFALFLFLPGLQAREKTFTVVIDAGHGGKDPGARGANINEKQINLAVALKLGQLIENNEEDVRVIYTRKTDRFIELDERANIANRNKVDLFISIHTNAVKRGSAVQGTETYTLGLARSEENLEVAMSENSAILLEDDYQQRYEGFDPNSSESYIIFEFMQNKHMEQSVSLASEIQKSFGACKRVDRGVRQAGFLVLRKTSMPSVLVELGYISNRKEEQFLRTAAGQNTLAEALYDAFSKYKRSYDRRKGSISGTVTAPVVDVVDVAEEISVEESSPIEESSPVVEGVRTPPPGSEADILNRKHRSVRQNATASSTTSVNRNTKGKVIYKIQFLTYNKKLPANSRLFKGYKNVDFYVEKGIYKYTYGETTDFNSIRKMRRVMAKDFKEAFIIAFKDGKKVKY
ncbi:MAG: N-acetylmuramoyl-L-alanine amidase [Parabacteroides sp.]|nr:N-acetylmuramoyl-L-alanine amidase [Parabacteroides sp.]